MLYRKYVILEHDNALYKLAKLELHNDGSHYLFMYGSKRSGKYTHKKVSYHASGRTNYFFTKEKVTFNEPVSKISQINFLSKIVVPDLTRLESITKTNLTSDHIVLPLKDKNNIAFDFFIVNKEIENLKAVFIYFDKFIFGINIEFGITHSLSDTDPIFLTPNKGLFEKQQMSKYQARIEFNNILYGDNTVKVIGPNSKGVFELIFITEMSRVPYIKIEFKKPYYVKILKASKCNIEFKIYTKKDNNIVRDIKYGEILNIFLDAEIYSDDDPIPEGFIKCEQTW